MHAIVAAGVVAVCGNSWHRHATPVVVDGWAVVGLVDLALCSVHMAWFLVETAEVVVETAAVVVELAGVVVETTAGRRGNGVIVVEMAGVVVDTLWIVLGTARIVVRAHVWAPGSSTI